MTIKESRKRFKIAQESWATILAARCWDSLVLAPGLGNPTEEFVGSIIQEMLKEGWNSSCGATPENMVPQKLIDTAQEIDQKIATQIKQWKEHRQCNPLHPNLQRYLDVKNRFCKTIGTAPRLVGMKECEGGYAYLPWHKGPPLEIPKPAEGDVLERVSRNSKFLELLSLEYGSGLPKSPLTKKLLSN